MRALEVSRWQQRRRVGWDATDVRNGGAARTMWETLVEWKGSTAEQAKKTQERSHWCLTWLKPSSKLAFRLCGLGQRSSKFSMKIMRVLCRYFQHQSCVQFEGCVAAAPEHHGHPPWFKMELLAPLHCAARRFEQGGQGVSASEVEGFFMEDITAFMEGRYNELAGIAEKVKVEEKLF